MTEAGHRHRWTGFELFLADDRPMVRQRCACGEVRTLRAFERTWTPPLDDADTEPMRGGIV